MTATLSQVRTALASVLSSVTGLNVHAFKPGSLTPPAAIVMPDGEFIQYSVSSDPAHDMQLVIGLFVQWGDDESASAQLDDLVSPTSATSVWAAVDNDRTLGGVVDSAQINSARNYGSYQYGDEPYYGCELTVSVLL